MSPAMVVLVHGAWHGAWCWDRVVEGLDAEGIAARAVELPGHGASTAPLTDLAGDAAAVADALDEVAGPCVLVGHSYGGAVVTQAGGHPAVAHVVYLAAFNLDVGESVARAAVDDPATAEVDHTGRPDLGAALISDDGGTTTRVRPERAAPIFYDDCSADDAAWAIARLTPQRTANFAEAPTIAAWHDHPSTYVVCGGDQAVHPDLQRILARRATDAVEWPTGHSPFLSRPDLVVHLLADLARNVV